jgi:hypothetical protein
MSWFTELFAGSVDKIITATGDAVDKLVTSDEERLTLKNQLILIQAKAQLDAQKQADDVETNLEKEITTRWQADMQSDDPAAKKVRPYSLVYMILFMSIIIVTDSIGGISFDVKPAYVDLIQTLLVTMVVAYFGSRGMEKWATIKNGK